MSGTPDGRTISTPELRALMEKPGVEVGWFLSWRRGRATVQLRAADGRTCAATVVDPE